MQNRLPYNLMRFEKRFLKMQRLNKMNIKYLSDLRNPKKVVQFLPILLAVWDDILIYDILDLQKSAKKCKFLKLVNCNY